MYRLFLNRRSVKISNCNLVLEEENLSNIKGCFSKIKIREIIPIDKILKNVTCECYLSEIHSEICAVKLQEQEHISVSSTSRLEPPPKSSKNE